MEINFKICGIIVVLVGLYIFIMTLNSGSKSQIDTFFDNFVNVKEGMTDAGRKKIKKDLEVLRKDYDELTKDVEMHEKAKQKDKDLYKEVLLLKKDVINMWSMMVAIDKGTYDIIDKIDEKTEKEIEEAGMIFTFLNKYKKLLKDSIKVYNPSQGEEGEKKK